MNSHLLKTMAAIVAADRSPGGAVHVTDAKVEHEERVSAPDVPGARVPPELVDRLLELYCGWRTENAAVRAAYEHLSHARGHDRGHAFVAYCAALDREASTARLYESQVRLVESFAGDPDPPGLARAGGRG
jgi:hypothetical protein